MWTAKGSSKLSLSWGNQRFGQNGAEIWWWKWHLQQEITPTSHGISHWLHYLTHMITVVSGKLCYSVISPTHIIPCYLIPNEMLAAFLHFSIQPPWDGCGSSGSMSETCGSTPPTGDVGCLGSIGGWRCIRASHLQQELCQTSRCRFSSCAQHTLVVFFRNDARTSPHAISVSWVPNIAPCR